MNYTLRVVLTLSLLISSQNALSMDLERVEAGAAIGAGAGLGALGFVALRWFGRAPKPATKPFDIRDHIEGPDRFSPDDIQRATHLLELCALTGPTRDNPWFAAKTEDDAQRALQTSQAECAMFGQGKCIVNEVGESCLEIHQTCQPVDKPFILKNPLTGEELPIDSPEAREMFTADDLAAAVEFQKLCALGFEGTLGSFRLKNKAQALAALATTKEKCVLYGDVRCSQAPNGEPAIKLEWLCRRGLDLDGPLLELTGEEFEALLASGGIGKQTDGQE